MEIIHVALGKANPNRMNGINKVVNQLATTQHKLGHRVSLWGITHSTEHDYPDRPYQTKLFRPWRAWQAVPKEMQEAVAALDKYAVVHIHGGFIPAFYNLSYLLDQHHIKFVFTPHGAYNTVAIQRALFKKSLYFQLFEKAILRRAKAVQLLGKSEMHALQLESCQQKKTLIPNGQTLEDGVVAPSTKPAHPRFIFCGRLLMKEKGLDLLLEGFALYLKQHKNAELLIVGDGPDRAFLQQRSRQLELLAKVQFLGSRYGTEKNNLLQSSHAHVLTSRNEGLPMAVLEAAALGVPSIVSPQTNMGDYITTYKAGLVLAENTPLHIAEALLQCTHEIESQQWGLKAAHNYRMLQAEFDWDIIAEKLVALYQC